MAPAPRRRDDAPGAPAPHRAPAPGASGMPRKVVAGVLSVLGAAIVTIAASALLRFGAVFVGLADVPAALHAMAASQQQHADSTLKYDRIDAQYLCVLAAPTAREKEHCILQAIR